MKKRKIYSQKKRVAFLTGTRADFGKIKSLISALHEEPAFEVHIFATGMHMSDKYGRTVEEVVKCGFRNIYEYDNGAGTGNYNHAIARTVHGFADFTSLVRPDLVIVHGDRVEALAAALVAAVDNILVAHIEGGEVSGAVDDHIRHSLSKLANVHFVAHDRAKRRLMQMGEEAKHIFVIGSPDLDIMSSGSLPSISQVKDRYEIPFDEYGIALYHPVTTEMDRIESQAEIFTGALLETGKKFVVIYPNNDLGNEVILDAYRKRLSPNPDFKLLPSMRFEYFLSLLKHAACIAGNSSCNIHEAPFYGVPSVNIGSRQNNRLDGKSIKSIRHVGYDKAEMAKAIGSCFGRKGRYKSAKYFGDGKSAERFKKALTSPGFWSIERQKRFVDLQ